MWTAAACWRYGRGPGYERHSEAYPAGDIGNPPVLLDLHATHETLVFHLSTFPLCFRANGLCTVALSVLATRTSVRFVSAAASDLAERRSDVCRHEVSLASSET